MRMPVSPEYWKTVRSKLRTTANLVRCQLTATPGDGEFPILKDLRRDGITDYIVLPVPFSDGTNKAVSLATNRTDAFFDSAIALFAAMIFAFSFNLEVQALRRMARTLLDTYVGRQAGGRVLEGQIKRGMGETIRAAIWLCDLRRFTSLSESLPRDELIEMLNQYFGPMCDAVDANNGEVLKFIGDAMLAIFPVIDNPAVACGHALSAPSSVELCPRPSRTAGAFSTLLESTKSPSRRAIVSRVADDVRKSTRCRCRIRSSLVCRDRVLQPKNRRRWIGRHILNIRRVDWSSRSCHVLR